MIEFNCGLQSSPICDIEVGASSVEGFGVPTLPQYPMLASRKPENEKGSVFSRCHVPSSSTRPTRYLRTMTNCYLRVAENSKHYTEEKVEKAPDVSRNTATARRLAKIKCRNTRFSKDCAEERSKHQTGPIFPEFQHGSLFEEHWRRGISQSFSAPSSTPQRFRHRFPPLLCRLSPEPCERGRAASLPVVHPVFISSRDKPSSECTVKSDIPLLLPRPGPQCCQPTGWRFVASCTTLRTRSCAVSGVGSRSGCSVLAHNACSRPLLGLAVLCFTIRLVIRLSSQASSVGPPATPRPPGLNRMRVQVRPVQALTRIEVCPGSRYEAHGKPRLTPATGPLPSRLPHQSAQFEPRKDQHQMGERYVYCPLLSPFLSNKRTPVEVHMTLGVGLVLQCNPVFSAPWSSFHRLSLLSSSLSVLQSSSTLVFNTTTCFPSTPARPPWRMVQNFKYTVALPTA